MGRPFRDEVALLPTSISWAAGLDIQALKRSIAAAAGLNLLVVGSGGSSTAAAFMAGLHERRFGDISKALTPLEFALSTTVLREAFIVMLSAEGKNKDILAAAASLAAEGHKGVAVTLTQSNPLVTMANENGTPTAFAFEMPWIKDGYLATNSLIAMMVLIGRVYAIDGERLQLELSKFDANWLNERRRIYSESGPWRNFLSNQPVIVLYGEYGRVTAIDIESKLAESALAFSQIVDYRQFAHGRHLQLASNGVPPLVLAIVSPCDADLAKATLDLLPKTISVHKIDLPSDPIIAEIAGVIEGILLTEAIATSKAIDPGQPDVPVFGREIHGLDFTGLKRSAVRPVPTIFRRKLPWLEKRADIPLNLIQSSWKFAQRLEKAQFKGLVCDFDGTYCDTNRRFEGLDVALIPHVERLLAAGVVVGFATGRGDSLQADLRQKIHRQYWPRILVGYYSGSAILALDQEFRPPPADQRFTSLAQWLRSIGLVKSEKDLRAAAGQLGLGCDSLHSRVHALSAIRQWIASTNVAGWRAYASGHSIDVITENAGKSKVVDAVAHFANCDAEHEILRIGDSGQFDGNDFELLSGGLGLSVASVSPLPESGWNFLPSGKSNAAGTLHYLAALNVRQGVAQFDQDFFLQIQNELEGYWPESRVEI